MLRCEGRLVGCRLISNNRPDPHTAMELSEDLLARVVAWNNEGVALISRDGEAALRLFIKLLPILSKLVDDPTVNDGAMYDCYVSSARTTLRDANFYTRGMMVTIGEPSCPDVSPFPKLLATVYYNAALAFHCKATASTESAHKILYISRSLYKSATEIMDFCAVAEHDPAILLLLAIYNNLSHVQRELCDMKAFHGMKCELLTLLARVETFVLEDEEAEFFLIGAITAGCGAVTASAA